MVTSRQELISSIESYTITEALEIEFKSKFLQLLHHPRAYFRDNLPGHITGSAWIVDESRKFVLLTHHAKLNKWLQPGGHADGDENIYNVALREAEEETGLADFKLLQHSIFDFDVHTIPARPDFPQHLHYDVRFIFKASRDQALTITEESHDLQWVALADIAQRTEHNQSMIRMAEKTKLL
ncbi:MAG: NUDIX hydrolase [Cyclobacteriaceae bacterium]|nr:NUDIX hydrolase [Cyclobacteriaceae bacterium]